MPSIPITPGLQPTETVEERFRRLEAIWKDETAHLSSSTAITNHPAFQEVISMGAVVLPLILGELQKKPSLLVWALPNITGAHPVPKEDRGNIAKMTEAWLRWGKENGYQW